MISVLIIDGFSDACGGDSYFEICNIYIPLLQALLRYNDVCCETVRTSGLEHEYGIVGKNSNNLIYVPAFSVQTDTAGVSFIFTDSTLSDSPAFRIASALRRKRAEFSKTITFVNALHENDPIKRFSPVIVDNINYCFDKCDQIKSNIYNYVLSTCECICDFYGNKQIKSFN